MRIVGGIYKGRTLTAFDGDKIRPTADKVRESLFNILQFKIAGASFLDLFAGTGAMGIEALSRGADSVTFNDASRESLKVLKTNLEKLKVTEKITVKNFDAVTLLKSSTQKFDIIYVDPPYKTTLGLDALKVAENAIKENGVIIFEDEKPFNGEISALKVTDRRKYGRVHLTFFVKGEN